MSNFTLLARCGLKRSQIKDISNTSIKLPSSSISKAIVLCPKHVSRYHEVVGWKGTQKQGIHPCYLHSLAFPLHLQLMLNKAFPFAVMGLVQLKNQIEQLAPLDKDLPINITTQFGQIEQHTKGYVFSISTKIQQDEHVVWQSISQFLNKIYSPNRPGNEQRKIFDSDLAHSSSIANWQVASAIGRQYARVAGDYNPIHLTKFMAMLFGFKRAIAHGMWSKAKCLSMLASHYDISSTIRCEVEFQKPLFIPDKVHLMTTEQVDTEKNIQFYLADSEKKTRFLTGYVSI